MIQYKKLIKPTVITEDELNELGKDGWDNYAIIGNSYFFKRHTDIKVAPAQQQHSKNGNQSRK